MSDTAPCVRAYRLEQEASRLRYSACARTETMLGLLACGRLEEGRDEGLRARGELMEACCLLHEADRLRREACPRDTARRGV